MLINKKLARLSVELYGFVFTVYIIRDMLLLMLLLMQSVRVYLFRLWMMGVRLIKQEVSVTWSGGFGLLA